MFGNLLYLRIRKCSVQSLDSNSNKATKTDISDFDTFFGDREQMLSEILKKKLGVEEKIKTIIRKHINNPSGSLAEFIKKCQSSAALEEDGLKDC